MRNDALDILVTINEFNVPLSVWFGSLGLDKY